MASPITSVSRQRAAASRDAGPHDLTGRRAISAKEQAEANSLAVDAAILELKDPDTAISWVTVPGRSAPYPIAREVMDHLRRALR
jgi:hypothetical protein